MTANRRAPLTRERPRWLPPLTRRPATGRSARRGRDGPPATRSVDAAPAPAVDHADGDADAVQRARRHHEPDAVEEAARARRQLGAVGVAVEDREEADDCRRRPQRRPPLGEHGEPEHDARERDADLDAGQRHAHEPEHAAEGHHHRERHRQQPHRRRAELRAPQADRHHRQHVVEAGDRVVESGEQALGAALLGVRPRERAARALTSEARRPRPQRCSRLARSSDGAHRAPREQHQRPLDRPVRPERPHRVARQVLDEPRPAHLEDPERALEQDHEQNERDLADLDAHVEEQQRERDLGLRQAHRGEAAREAEAVEEAEREGDHPRVADREARLPAPACARSRGRGRGCSGRSRRSAAAAARSRSRAWRSRA